MSNVKGCCGGKKNPTKDQGEDVDAKMFVVLKRGCVPVFLECGMDDDLGRCSADDFVKEEFGWDDACVTLVPNAWVPVLETYDEMASDYPLFAQHVLNAVVDDPYSSNKFVDCLLTLFDHVVRSSLERRSITGTEASEIRKNVTARLGWWFKEGCAPHSEQSHVSEYERDCLFYDALVDLVDKVESSIDYEVYKSSNH